jgi:hypothetical protein
VSFFLRLPTCLKWIGYPCFKILPHVLSVDMLFFLSVSLGPHLATHVSTWHVHLSPVDVPTILLRSLLTQKCFRFLNWRSEAICSTDQRRKWMSNWHEHWFHVWTCARSTNRHRGIWDRYNLLFDKEIQSMLIFIWTWNLFRLLFIRAKATTVL